ncbi:hypothetical protein GCM10009779_21510 [Polymorphospora rubra]|uniref:Lipoprotein n=2 Tax=Polymorphospora rubra TaxID=338584 RepID=A0A810MY93_9ACTN|nr:hypothetical protein Prubr_30830 [Polymorphospora rubra]
MMQRRALVALAVVGGLALAGCTGDEPGPTMVSAGPDTAATPTRPAVDSDVSPKGMGPYLVGVKLADLQTAGLVGDTEKADGCPDLALGKGLPDYAVPALVFDDGQLVRLTVSTPAVRTTEGGRVAMTRAEVEANHPDGRQLAGRAGASGWLVTEDVNGLLFRFDGEDRVESIEAGESAAIQRRFTNGREC